MHGIVCRKANISDQKFLDDMSKGMYGGVDYAPKMFPVWLSDENWQPFVAEVSSSGDVVGFLALHIIDNKTRVIIRSSRVAQQYRNNGVYSRLLHYSLLTVKEMFSSINAVVISQRLTVKTPEGYKLQKRHAYEVVRCGNRSPVNECHCLLCNSGNTDAQDQSYIVSKRFAINHKSFSCLYETKKALIQELFPRNVVFIEEAPYNLDLKENREFLDKQKLLVAGFSEDEDYKVMSIVDLRQRESVDGNKVYYVDLYGNNSAVILQHALNAIGMASRQADGKVFDICLQMHSKEAEAIVCHFRNCKCFNATVRGGGLKVSEAEIDIVISNMLKKFNNN
eukprot:gene64-660_t